ncbi:biotin/lipoyl-binding protein [Urechidicola sp. KH5]
MKRLTYTILVLIGAIAIGCSKSEISNGLKGKVKREVLTLSSKYPGKVLEQYVEEGDVVTMGDTLMELDFPEVEAKLAQAQGAVSAAKAQYEMALKGATSDELAQVSAKLDAVTEQYKFAEKSFNRIDAMHKDSLVSDQQYDEVFVKYQGAKSQYEGVLAKYNQVKTGVRNEKIRMALGTYEQAKGALQEANVAYDARFIVAPQKMTIETMTLKEGELALPGYGLFTGYDMNSTYFRFTVSEKDISSYKKGNTYSISSPFTNASYEGTLVAIKQLSHYADVTTAFPEYELGEAIYELKLIPNDVQKSNELYANLSVILE